MSTDKELSQHVIDELDFGPTIDSANTGVGRQRGSFGLP